MTHQCPNCGRPVAERKSSRCLYCDAEIPPAAHFSPEEHAAMDLEQEEVEEFLLKRRLHEIEERSKQQQSIPPSSWQSGT